MSIKLYHLDHIREGCISNKELLMLDPILVMMLNYMDLLKDLVIQYLYEFQKGLLDDIL
jgi:hypothetical protein